MDQEKIGKLIKKIRQDNNLTQQELANKYGITYQAVSKWENGKALPDIALLKEICHDFNIDINDLLDGNYKKKSINKKYLLITTIIIILITISIIIFYNTKKEYFHFKSLSSSCSAFTIKGTVAYNNNQSSIYISNIDYCGGDDNTIYKEIECILYEKDKNNISKEINKKKSNNSTIEDYLKDITFKVNNYDRLCKNFTKNSLYLTIKATTDDDKLL
ncbi:XRE family transcriptional regulator, partial [bacterium]|nr:XRE family transcriptional regulator [bacterium]